MQEWLNLTRDDVSRLRLTLPLVSFLVGLLAYRFTPEDVDCKLLQNAGFYQPYHMVPKPKTSIIIIVHSLKTSNLIKMLLFGFECYSKLS
jgi:hypothetical protein